MPAASDWTTPLSEEQKIRQLLSRITFGPRPGDVERVRRQGLRAFLEEQLHPERIDDSLTDTRISALPTLAMTPPELVESFPEANHMARPHRPGQTATKTALEATSNPGQPASAAGLPGMSAGNDRARVPRDVADLEGPRRVLMELAQEELLRAVYGSRQLQEVMVQFWMNHFNIFAPKGADRWLVTSFERDTIRGHALGKFEDLLKATAMSPAMLFYLDNWLSTAPHGALTAGFNGRAKPATWRSDWRASNPSELASHPWASRTSPPGAQASAPPSNRHGLNENYARELMELHTLGVDGGYTQRDVIEVARCLTGWTISRPGQGGGFVFNPRMHDWGEKVVLGHKIPAGHGVEDGQRVLRLLARHESTAHFTSLKLCRRFVADDPPTALVNRASATFRHTHGDIRFVLKTILTSREFFSQAAYGAKVKSPLELVASSLRALGSRTDAGLPLLQFIAQMGQPMFQYPAPTGFSDRARSWINSGTLLMRLNFATLLASNRIRGTQVDFDGVESRDAGPGQASEAGTLDRALSSLDDQLLGGALSAKTRQAILQKATGFEPVRGDQRNGATSGEPPREMATMAALMLASPEFQRR